MRVGWPIVHKILMFILEILFFFFFNYCLSMLGIFLKNKKLGKNNDLCKDKNINQKEEDKTSRGGKFLPAVIFKLVDLT